MGRVLLRTACPPGEKRSTGGGGSLNLCLTSPSDAPPPEGLHLSELLMILSSRIRNGAAAAY